MAATSSWPGRRMTRLPEKAGSGTVGPRLLPVVATLARALVAIAAVAVMIGVRSSSSVLVNLALTVVAGGAFYFVFGRAKKTRLVVVYLMAFGAFSQFRALAVHTGVPANFEYVTHLDRAVFGQIPSAWLQGHFYSLGSLNALDWSASAVYVSYFFAAHALAAWIWLRRRDQFPLYAGAVLLTYYLGLLIYFVVPTAPPWLAAQDGYIPTVHRVFRDLAGQVRPGSYDAGLTVAGVNDVAAMPSLHMAITVVVAIALWSKGRLWRIVGVAYVAAMGLALVYLGEHYVSDEVAGALLAIIAWRIARAICDGMAHKAAKTALVGNSPRI